METPVRSATTYTAFNRPVDQIFNGFSFANKRAIRKSEGQDMLVDQSYSTDSLKPITASQNPCLRLPPTLELFRAIHENIPRVVSSSPSIVKGLLRRLRILLLGFQFIYKFGGSNERFQAARPNNFLFGQRSNS